MLEKKFLNVKKMYFQQTPSKIMSRNFCKYIVTEKKIFLEYLELKGMSFIIYKRIKFW